MRSKEKVETVFNDYLLTGHRVKRTGTMYVRRTVLKDATKELLWLQDIYYRFGEEGALRYLSEEYHLPAKGAKRLFEFITERNTTELGRLLAKKHLKVDIPKAILMKEEKGLKLVLDKEALSFFPLGEIVTNEIPENKQ